MSVLWAFIALLSIHIGGLSGVSGQLFPPPQLLPSLKLNENLQRLQENFPKLPIPAGPVPGIPPQPKKKPQKDPAETNGQHCEASAWYFISKKKVDEYLNDTVPEAIKNLVNCAEYELTGLLKTVLELLPEGGESDVTNSLSLDGLTGLTSSLSLGGLTSSLPLGSLTKSLPLGSLTKSLPLGSLTKSLPLDGLTKSLPLDGLKSSLPLPGGLPGNPLPGNVGGSPNLNLAPDLGGNGNKLLSSLGRAKNVLGQSGNPLEGKNPGDLLKSASKSVKDSDESQGLDKSEDLIKKAVPFGPNGVNLGAIQENPAKIGDVFDKLDLKLHASNIIIKNITTEPKGNYIDVQAYVEADIKGSDDLLGSVVDLLSFKVEISVQLKIGLNKNDTKCIPFEIVEKVMKVEKITIKIIDRLTGQVLGVIPLPLPLDSIISALLMVNATSPEGECNLTLKNSACKNEATVSAKGDLFTYHVKQWTFTPKGLLIFYCAEVNYKDKPIPVAGGPSPLISEDSEATLALSSNIVKALVTGVAKESFVKSKDGELKVKMMSYKLLNKKAQLSTHADLKENGIKTAGLDSLINLSHSCVVNNGYLSGNVALVSSDNKIDPPDNEVAKEMGKQLVAKVLSNTNDHLRHMNVPLGPQSELLNGVPFQVDSQGDIIASK